jgi:hypothetical protein
MVLQRRRTRKKRINKKIRRNHVKVPKAQILKKMKSHNQRRLRNQ